MTNNPVQQQQQQPQSQTQQQQPLHSVPQPQQQPQQQQQPPQQQPQLRTRRFKVPPPIKCISEPLDGGSHESYEMMTPAMTMSPNRQVVPLVKFRLQKKTKAYMQFTFFRIRSYLICC